MVNKMLKLFFILLFCFINIKPVFSEDFILGLKAFKSQDYDTAFEQFLSLAETGDIRAQTYIGMMYFNGLSVPKNLETAAGWYIKAAEEGHPHAQFYLGWMYDHGKGLEKNKELAFKWLETAAKQGHPRAQNNVGVMYYKGEGVKKDLLLAQMWYMISSSKGMSEAKENMITLNDNLTKKEKLNIERTKEKLELNLGGIKNMPNLPDAIFIIDINKESIAVQEAKKLNIPVIAICDTNTDPSDIDYPIPGNDDAVRSISLYCDLIGSAILSGMEENLAESGVDIGNSDVNVDEDIPSDKEIETIQDNNEKESVENEDNINLNLDSQNNSVSN